MRAKEFLVEDEKDAKVMANLILRDCKPYLEQISYNIKEYPLYRGVPDSRLTFGALPNPENRPSRDTPTKIHEAMDNWFEKKFGIRYRSNALFVTGDKNMTSDYYAGMTYGDLLLIFPIGDFRFCWSTKADDVMDELPTIGNAMEPDQTDVEAWKEWSLKSHGTGFSYQQPLPERGIKRIEGILTGLNYIDYNLLNAIKSGHEIMIHGKGFYFLSLENSHFKTLKDTVTYIQKGQVDEV